MEQQVNNEAQVNRDDVIARAMGIKDFQDVQARQNEVAENNNQLIQSMAAQIQQIQQDINSLKEAMGMNMQGQVSQADMPVDITSPQQAPMLDPAQLGAILAQQQPQQ